VSVGDDKFESGELKKTAQMEDTTFVPVLVKFKDNGDCRVGVHFLIYSVFN